jgi:hypothetical protein
MCYRGHVSTGALAREVAKGGDSLLTISDTSGSNDCCDRL